MKRFIILMTGLSRESSWHEPVQMTQVRETSGFGFYCGWEMGQGFCGLNFKPVPREGSVDCLIAWTKCGTEEKGTGEKGSCLKPFRSNIQNAVFLLVSHNSADIPKTVELNALNG